VPFLAKGQRIWDLLIVVDKNHPKIELENKSSKGFTYKKREPPKKEKKKGLSNNILCSLNFFFFN